MLSPLPQTHKQLEAEITALMPIRAVIRPDTGEVRACSVLLYPRSSWAGSSAELGWPGKTRGGSHPVLCVLVLKDQGMIFSAM